MLKRIRVFPRILPAQLNPTKMVGHSIHDSSIAIVGGGTGGHIFPGVAVANELKQRGRRVIFFLSDRSVDQAAAKDLSDIELVKLPVTSFSVNSPGGFLVRLGRAFIASWKAMRPNCSALLSMGGYVGAAPILAARCLRVPVYLHESNAIPGRANRFFSPWAGKICTGFDSAARHFLNTNVETTGTPVRAELRGADATASRKELGLMPDKPVLLVMGGSQGARSINRIVFEQLAQLKSNCPNLQFLHLTGFDDFDWVTNQYKQASMPAIVRAFVSDMRPIYGAATVAVCRSGASSLAELAATRVPSILIPLPTATDNHQWHNANIFSSAGAAILLTQTGAAAFADRCARLVNDSALRDEMSKQLSKLDAGSPITRIADILEGRCLKAHQNKVALLTLGVGVMRCTLS